MNLSGHQGRTEFLGEEQSCAKARCLISSAVRQVSRAAEEQREVRLERKAEARTGYGRPHRPAQRRSLTSAPAGREATQAEARRQRPIHLVFWEDSYVSSAERGPKDEI